LRRLAAEAAVTAFNEWSDAYLYAKEARNKVAAPLYHYTDAAGLEGIVKNQQVWFTSYTHLNDPTEIEYGMSIASELLSEIGQGSDPRIKIFCDMVNDRFTNKNLHSAFGFFIASFSQERDDLAHWRAYGDNGRGFSLGLAPHLFHVEYEADRQPYPHVFGEPVVYGKHAARHRHMPAIEKAVRIVGETVGQAADLMQDKPTGMSFLEEMANALIASQMILNSLTVKHEAYQHEKEVRLFILGEHRNLTPHVSTRARPGDIVPFIKSDMPVQANGSIVEIVAGPSAADSAEDGVRALLRPFHDAPDSIVRRSTIPYRAQ
jgi:hypothetical protein